MDDLDIEIIGGLYTMLGREKLSELLDGYFTHTEQIIDALNTEEGEEIYARAHELKGMSANYGFTALSIAAREIEDAVQAKTPQDELIKKLPDTYRRARNSIDEWLDSQS